MCNWILKQNFSARQMPFTVVLKYAERGTEVTLQTVVPSLLLATFSS